MPRRNRCVLPEVPCHITQRGVDRCETFSEDQDRLTYLRLVQENLNDAGVRILAYCLMTNHVHLIAVPAREDSLSILENRGQTGRFLIVIFSHGSPAWLVAVDFPTSSRNAQMCGSSF